MADTLSNTEGPAQDHYVQHLLALVFRVVHRRRARSDYRGLFATRTLIITLTLAAAQQAGPVRSHGGVGYRCAHKRRRRAVMVIASIAPGPWIPS